MQQNDDMTYREIYKSMKALMAERDAAGERLMSGIENSNERAEAVLAVCVAMLKEVVERDNDKLAGDGYVSLTNVAKHFGVTSKTIKAWGKDRSFPAPLGGWEHEGKRAELRFWKPQLRAWRAMMHGADPHRAEKLLAATVPGGV